MRTVSRFEANLLHILHAFLRRTPLEPVWALVREPCPRPRCLGRDAVELVQDALAKGCAQWLARQGGWRRERHLRGERVAEGRLWQRTAPAELGLQFSRHSLGFLVWVTTTKLDDAQAPPWGAPERELTPADRLLLFLAYDMMAGVKDRETMGGTPALALLRASAPIYRNALCRLAHPEDFTEAPEDGQPDFAPWTSGTGACILEVLQQRLAARCVEVEWKKRQIEDWQRRQAVGRSQERVLGAFLEAADKAGRWDLARYVLRAAAELLTEDVTAGWWVGSLTEAGPRLADRADTYRATLTLPHLLTRLRDWARRARAVGYFDEGYPASQLWKADWEHWQGDGLATRAQVIIQQLDPMKQT